MAADGALEELQKQSDGLNTWAPVVPDGDFRPGHSWKSFFFESTHVGPFGGHRNAAQSLEMLRRFCTWSSIDKDVESWVDA